PTVTGPIGSRRMCADQLRKAECASLAEVLEPKQMPPVVGRPRATRIALSTDEQGGNPIIQALRINLPRVVAIGMKNHRIVADPASWEIVAVIGGEAGDIGQHSRFRRVAY